LDLSQLEDYEAREKAASERHIKALADGKTTNYPVNRFRKLNYPIARRANHCSLWAQVPLYGSLVVPIYPVRRENFQEIHGFDLKEFPELIDFWKDTGHIQFVLGTTHLQYRELDYLDILLEERPPTMFGEFPHDNIEPKVLERWEAEFRTASQAVFFSDFMETYDDQGFSIDVAYSRLRDMELAYIWLRANGRDEVAQEIIESMAADPLKASAILYFYRAFIVVPAIQPIPMMTNISYDDLRTFRTVGGKVIPAKNVLFPAEIGALLLRKLIPVPDGFESCKALTERFAHADLQSLVQTLSSSISTSDADLARSSVRDVGEALDKIWIASGKVENKIRGVSYGIHYSLSATGFVAGQLMTTGLTGTSMGLLAGLGFHVLDTSLGGLSRGIASKVVKSRQQSSTLAVFDFREKHNLLRST